MGVGAPPKLDLALQIGAALATSGSPTSIASRVSPLGDDEAPALPPGARQGRDPADPALPRRRARRAGASGWRRRCGRSCRGGGGRRRGLAIVISDFYDPAGHRAALDLLRHHRLRGRRHPGERAARRWRPTLHGDVELRDVETGEARELTVSPAVLAAYRRRHQALLRDLEGYCRERAHPLLHGRLRPALRRGRAAHVPRGRPAALSEPR